MTKKASPRKTTKKEQKPKTAYDLCELVAQHIEAEPARYYQRCWVATGPELKRLVSLGTLPEFPPCGTTACRAGWIVGLHDGLKRAASAEPFIPDRARLILGVTARATKTLFAASDTSPLNEPGTPEYAAYGAAGLRKWMRRRAKHLKARLLKGVPKWSKRAMLGARERDRL